MISKMKFVFIVAGITALILAACGGPTPAATHAINETATTRASPTLPAATTDTPTATEVSEATATNVALVTTGISYLNDVLPILKSRCANCHGANNPREGLIVITYASLMAGSKNGIVVIAGDPDNSLLIKQIQDGEMPKRGPKLTPEQLQILIDWILQGALNN